MPGHAAELSWVNGQAGHGLSLLDRGLQYGDGLFETGLFLDGNIILCEQHLARIERDTARLSINLDVRQLKGELQDFTQELARRCWRRGIIKIIITREYVRRGYSIDKSATCQRILHYFDGVHYPAANRSGIRLLLSSQKLAINPALAGIKHLNRLEQVLAATAWSHQQRGLASAEALLLDQSQAVTEALTSNIFLVQQQHLVTPLLDRCGVRGVMRDYLLDKAAPALKIPVVEARITLTDLLQADEVFVCNSVYGIWPVSWLEVVSFSVGPLTSQLQKAIDELGYEKIYH